MPWGMKYEVTSLDKYEYKVRADEIKSLISEGDYEEAVKIADTIDWRRVKSVMMLCTISDLYKINRRYEDSKDILLLAYEKHTGGRLIVYSLCELSIKLGEYVQALEYYKEFVQLAPKDSGRYVLQYKLYEAQEVSLEERIEVLEELKKRDYREKWAYELAYLYHRVGLASKCIEECDEMTLWFGEGRYVLKALELKMLHEPLNAEQQAKYEQMKLTGGFIQSEFIAEQQTIMEKAEAETEEEEDDEFSLQENILTDSTKEMPAKEDIDIQVKTVDVSQYNTINLQKELAESMKEFLEENKTQDIPVEEAQQSLQKNPDETAVSEVKPVLESEPETKPDLKFTEVKKQSDENASQEVFFGNTEEVNVQDVVSELIQKSSLVSPFAPVGEQIKMQELSLPEASPNPALSNTGVIKTFTKPSGYDNMLSQEYDGQISLVMPEEEKIEKQITGQLSIEDIMAEWERMKQENERKRMETIRQRVLQQTNTLFADFDESTKSGLLEDLEKAMMKAAIKEEKQKTALEQPKVIKVADIENEINQDKEEISEVSSEESIIEETAGTSKEPEMELPVSEEEELGADSAAEIIEEKISDTAGEKEAATDSAVETSKESSEDKAEEKSELSDENEDKYTVREMTNGEREQFAPFIHHKKTRRQIVETIDNISMASYTGNVIITGEEGTRTIALAKLLVKEIQLSDSNFSGKVAKISGTTLNKKEIAATLSKLSNGALIIEKAAAMKKVTVENLLKELNQEEKGLIILMEDTKSAMNELLKKNPDIKHAFNLRVDIEALDDQTLVKYAKRYALDQEYSIDELGVLALHTRIADMQTIDHEVTLAEIEELVDEAIYYADRKTPKHFLDILVGKRYDEEDMIVLREKDFMHN